LRDPNQQELFHPSGQADPVELNFHAPVLIGPDLFAAFACHDRGLRSVNDRLGRNERRTEDEIRGNRLERVGVFLLIALHRDFPHNVGDVHRLAHMLRQRKLAAGDESLNRGCAPEDFALVFKRGEPPARDGRSGIIRCEAAGYSYQRIPSPSAVARRSVSDVSKWKSSTAYLAVVISCSREHL